MSEIPGTGPTDPSPPSVYDFPRARRRAAASAPRRDSTGVTRAVRDLNEARAAAEAAPNLRAERVETLRKQIAEGTYNPDPREIAREILGRGL